MSKGGWRYGQQKVAPNLFWYGDFAAIKQKSQQGGKGGSSSGTASGALTTTVPDAPTGFSATGVTGGIMLAWNANPEPDIQGYRLFAAEGVGETFAQATQIFQGSALNYLFPGLLEAVHERLTSVVIECLPYEDFIRRYDRAGALFYLDPPYYGSEADYSDTADLFSRVDFDRLALVLRTIKGRFLMPLNDHPGVRRAFAAFTFEEIETTYTLGGNGTAKRVEEVIIKNA